MRIFGIGVNYPYEKQLGKLQKPNYNFISGSGLSESLKVDTVSFGRTATNAEKMRCMFKYGMIDIHTGQKVIDPELFETFLQKGLFTQSVQSIVRTLTPLKNTLHNVEAQLFAHLEEYAKTRPLYRLDDIIQSLAPKAQSRLLELQRPIFDKLKALSVSMPFAQKEAFDSLMEMTEKQLENKPIAYKFSKKEFKYQLERIAQDIRNRGIKEEIKTTETLIKMSNKMPYMPSGRNYSRKRSKFNPEKSIAQAAMIRQISGYFSRSVLKNDKALQDLFDNAKKQIFNIPMVIPFKRKTFNHTLKSITDTLEDKNLARELMKTASKLPTAQEELSAFIMKSSRNSSEKIGYDLLYGSVGAIDHLEPWSHGGADAIENYAFTSNALNSSRGNKTIATWLRLNPKTYKGTQKCINRLVELYEKGVLEKEGLTPWYIVFFARKMEKLSPEDKKFKADLGNLLEKLKQ